jgi:electron transfer flavoprotein alpha subunit
MAEYKDIAVFAEVKQGKLAPITAEGLGIGRKLADASGQQLAAVLVGSGVAALAQEAITCGADKVYVVDSPALENYRADAYIAVMERVTDRVKPQVLIMGQTDIGRDLAPGLAFKLGTAANLDCIELAIDADSKRLLQTKPVYGGNANAVYITGTDPQIVTIRTKAMTPLEPDASRQGEVINIRWPRGFCPAGRAGQAAQGSGGGQPPPLR